MCVEETLRMLSGSGQFTDAEWNFAQGSLINVKVMVREREPEK